VKKNRRIKGKGKRRYKRGNKALDFLV
jgi:hypothetical protein